MAKKYTIGGMLIFGAATAVIGGIAAYRHRKKIEEAVQEISDQLEENDVFTVEPEENIVVHTTEVPKAEENMDAEEGEPDDDFVDLGAETKAPVAEDAENTEPEKEQN